MSIITKIFGIDKAADQAIEKALNQGTLQTIAANRLIRQGWSSAVYPAYNPSTAFERAFKENDVFYAVLDRICEKFGHIPRYVYQEKMAKRKSLDENTADSDLARLMLSPNDYQGQDQFFYFCALSYKTTGECFIWKNRGDVEGGKPVELYVIPPWCIHPVSDGTIYGVEKYELVIGGQVTPLPANDVIHWRKPNLVLDQTGSQLRGFNPIFPLRKTLTQADSITDASVGMYQQGGAKGILYNKTLDNLTDTQKEQIQAVVDKKINNNDRKGAVATIQGDWGYLNVGLDSVDMQLLEAEEKVVRRICFSCGFPIELFTGDATHANRQQALRFLLTQTIQPLVASLDAELNRSLAPDFKGEGFIASDMSELPEMQEMRLELVKALVELPLSPNEIREAGGWDRIEDAALDIVYAKSGLQPYSELSIGDPNNDNTSDYADAE